MRTVRPVDRKRNESRYVHSGGREIRYYKTCQTVIRYGNVELRLVELTLIYNAGTPSTQRVRDWVSRAYKYTYTEDIDARCKYTHGY